MVQPISKITASPAGKIKLLTKLRFRRPVISVRFFLALVMILVIVLEVGLLYFFLYQNVVFKDKTTTAKTTSEVTRINFENYEKVVKRLDEVALYQPPASISFYSFVEDVGRDNPFADPE